MAARMLEEVPVATLVEKQQAKLKEADTSLMYHAAVTRGVKIGRPVPLHGEDR